MVKGYIIALAIVLGLLCLLSVLQAGPGEKRIALGYLTMTDDDRLP